MKKLFFALMTAATLSLAACGGSNTTAAPGESDPQAELPEEADDLAATLQTELQNNNAEGFAGLVMNLPEKVTAIFQDNPLKALGYVQTAQTFLKENKDAITNILGKLGNNDLAERANALIGTLSDQSPLQFLGSMNLPISDELQQKADELKGKADELLENLPEGVQDAIGGLLNQ